MRLKQTKRKTCKKILREIVFNFMFVGILFMICYSERNQAINFAYQNHVRNSFDSFKEVIILFLVEKKFINVIF